MNHGEVEQLRNFSLSERIYNSPSRVPWLHYDNRTMQIIDDLRDFWGKPIYLIRGGFEHGAGKETAVDFVASGLSTLDIFMGMSRICGSWGQYRGGSVHLDRRETADAIQHRWFGFKPHDRSILEQSLNRKYIGKEQDGWIYCAFQPECLELLALLEAGVAS